MLEKISNFIVGIVEGRDPDLAGHSRRIGDTTTRFGQHLGLSKEEETLLSIAGRIHDIGKLAISDHILNKPVKLTAAEFTLVKQHTVIGARLVAPLDIDPRISEIILYHHENFDGTGYPKNSSGTDIPFLARITRICDSFDALTMDRPYHQGVSSSKALEILNREAQVFDPEYLREFCKMLG